MADFDPALVDTRIFERKWKPDVEHHCRADDVGAGFEAAVGAGAGHGERLGGRPARLKRSSCDGIQAWHSDICVRQGEMLRQLDGGKILQEH